jgi:hypothetical protein
MFDLCESNGRTSSPAPMADAWGEVPPSPHASDDEGDGPKDWLDDAALYAAAEAAEAPQDGGFARAGGEEGCIECGEAR